MELLKEIYDKEKEFLDFTIRSRDEWGAIPVSLPPVKNPVTHVFLAYTMTGPCMNDMECVYGMQRLQKYYMEEEKLTDLPYNFMIGGNGYVYEGRGWRCAPALPDQYSHLSDQSIMIGCVGVKNDGFTTPEMLIAQNELIKLGMDHNYIKLNILFRRLEYYGSEADYITKADGEEEKLISK